MPGGSRRTVAVVILVLSVAGLAVPAGAVPPGGPSVSLSIEHVDGLTHRVTADVRDPDGRVSAIEICIEDGDGTHCAKQSIETRSGPVTQVRTCIDGDQRSFGITHTFPEPGVYPVRATAVAGGCPIVGSDDAGWSEDVIFASGSPTSIPCADGDPATVTDIGVTADTIQLGATAVRSGIGPAAWGQGELGIRAATERVNETGGVCGRTLDVKIDDDGGDAAAGHAAIRRFIEDDTFALVAMPSPEGLGAAIESGDIDAAGIPVVGTTGHHRAELTSPWVWASGTAADAFGRISVEDAYQREAREFGLVFVRSPSFGPTAGAAAKHAIEARQGAVLRVAVQIAPGQPSYSSEIGLFNNSCATCDAVILIMDPVTAATWMAGRPRLGTVVTSGYPLLMQERFAQNCGRSCEGLEVWTGYEAPLPPATGVGAAYVRDLRRVSETADPADSSIQGAYVGTLLLATALGQTGTDLTREGLRDVLDSAPIDLGLTPAPLDWTSTRRGNRTMRPYEMRYVQGTFAGFERTGEPVPDPGT